MKFGFTVVGKKVNALLFIDCLVLSFKRKPYLLAQLVKAYENGEHVGAQ
jgi:hypothetical protein